MTPQIPIRHRLGELELWTLRGVGVLMSALEPDMPAALRAAVERRALANLTGCCACGATVDAVRAVAPGLASGAMAHEDDCPAGDPIIGRMLGAWGGQRGGGRGVKSLGDRPALVPLGSHVLAKTEVRVSVGRAVMTGIAVTEAVRMRTVVRTAEVPQSATCARCGQNIARRPPTGPPPIYCTTRCMRRAKWERVDREAKNAADRVRRQARRKPCLTCGASLVGRASNQRYCGDPCLSPNTWNRQLIARICAVCATPFTTRYLRQQYCSGVCSSRASHRRRYAAGVREKGARTAA